MLIRDSVSCRSTVCGFVLLYRADRLFEIKKLLTLIDFLSPVFSQTRTANVVIAIREGEDERLPDADALAGLHNMLKRHPRPLAIELFEGNAESAQRIVSTHFAKALPEGW